MKGKFGVAALMFSSMTFAVPVSTPNDLSDTPIISGGGSGERLSMNNCRAYQTDGAAIDLSGGETLVFYGGGQRKNGGYLATKTTYSGTAYVKLSKKCTANWENSNWQIYCNSNDGTAIGLFARNTDAQQDFIAGAGGSFNGFSFGATFCWTASGGGWQGEPSLCSNGGSTSLQGGGSIYDLHDSMFSYWFHAYPIPNSWYLSASAGFHGYWLGGGASSISAWYNYYTKDYTSPITSATITGGGITGQGRLYVCQ
jgi:hypothetical protein